LWVILCAIAAKAGLSLPATGWLLSLACGVAALVVTWMELRARAGLRAAWVVCGLVAASGPLAVAAMSGEGAALDALLAILLVVLLGHAGHGRARWIGAGVVGALFAMCASALALVFPVALAIRVGSARGKDAPRAGAVLAGFVFMAGVVAFHAWRLHTFGSLDARTPVLDTGRASLGDLFVLQPYDMAPFGAYYAMLFAAAGVGVAVSRQQSTPYLALGAAIATGVVTLTSRDPLPGLGGSAALVPLLAIPVAQLVGAVPRDGRPRSLDAVVVCSLLVVTLGWAADLRVSARHIRASYDLTLAPLGKWMAQWRKDGSLLCDAPGTVPYYAGWRTSVIGGEAMLPDAPDVVIVTTTFAGALDAEGARAVRALGDRYRALAGIRRDWARDREFIVYARNDMPGLTDSMVKALPPGLNR
jgi:hypothetical protein